MNVQPFKVLTPGYVDLDDTEPPFDHNYQPPGEPIEAVPAAEFKSAAAFCREYTPVSYAVEPFVRSASLYTLTARTGAGKTALLIIIALAVAADRGEILGREITRGRIAYIAAENPDDFRMRLKVAAFAFNIDLDALGDKLVVLDQKMKPEALEAKLKKLAAEAPFSLVIVDTLQAFFDGTDLNDNVQGGEFMRKLRRLTALSGMPSVIVAAHPVKRAREDDLVPYGGGAILNEVDGNLTLCNSAGITTLHWQGKLRGVEFQPALFRFDIVGSPDVLDVKNRQVQLPLLRPTTEEEAERREQAAVDQDAALLKAMAADPGGSLSAWSGATGISKTTVKRRLDRMRSADGGKLVENTLGKWSLAAAGRKAVRDGE